MIFLGRRRPSCSSAALNDKGDVGEIVAAARLVSDEIADEHLAPAAAAGLLRIRSGAVEFRHPLIRSAVHGSATGEERRAAHFALAETLVGDPDRSVWHRAQAATSPDEVVVQMLETAAERARKRGAESTAVAAFERAARLSASEAARGSYLIRAADIAMELGWTNVVLRLLGEAEPLELEPIDRTRLLLYLEQFEPRWTGATKVPALVEMATALAHDGDDLRAVQVLSDVAFRCWWGNPPPETRSLVVNAATSLELPPSTPALLFVLGLADPVGQGAEVVERLSLLQSEPDREPLESLELGVAGTAVWADDIALHFLDAAASGARAQGRLGLLAQTLVSHAWAALELGKWDTASTSAAEAAVLAGETSQIRWVVVARLAEAAVAASRGDTDRAERIVAECEQPLLAYGAHPLLALVQRVRGRSLLAAGRHQDAYEELRRIFDPSEPPYQPFASVWALVDLAEAASHAGAVAEARDLVQPLEAVAARSGGELLHSSLRFARAVLSEPEEIESQLEDALSTDLTAWPFTRARLLLIYGAQLRRRRGVAASRAPLRAARASFDALGAVPWAERAAQELRRFRRGPTAAPRRSSSRADRAGVADRPHGRRRADKPPDRTEAVSLTQNDLHPPLPDLSEARRDLPRTTAPSPRGLRGVVDDKSFDVGEAGGRPLPSSSQRRGHRTPREGRNEMSDKPSIVLVHGFWGGAAHWAKVIVELERVEATTRSTPWRIP